jgi:hypothetical protein
VSGKLIYLNQGIWLLCVDSLRVPLQWRILPQVWSFEQCLTEVAVRLHNLCICAGYVIVCHTNSQVIRYVVRLNDSSKAFSKASYPHSTIQCCLFQILVSSLFLEAIQELLTSSSPSSCPSSITCFRRQFQCKMWPIPLALVFRRVRKIYINYC